jgi:hypothetical protein
MRRGSSRRSRGVRSSRSKVPVRLLVAEASVPEEITDFDFGTFASPAATNLDYGTFASPSGSNDFGVFSGAVVTVEEN